jgi:hypothetical protein
MYPRLATAEIIADHRNSANLTYIVGGVSQQSNKFSFAAGTHTASLSVAVTGIYVISLFITNRDYSFSYFGRI